MVLKRVNYEKKELDRRRKESAHDVLVWTNERIGQWLLNINGLKDYANHLSETGIHGGLLALDDTFDWNTLALALQIPSQQTMVSQDEYQTNHIVFLQTRQILEREFRLLITNGTDRKMDEVSIRTKKAHTYLFQLTFVSVLIDQG